MFDTRELISTVATRLFKQNACHIQEKAADASVSMDEIRVLAGEKRGIEKLWQALLIELNKREDD